MIDMLKSETKNPEVERVIEKYGVGFDVIYFDGKAEGISQTNQKIAKNLIAEGFDDEFISRVTDVSKGEIRKLKDDIPSS